MLVNEAHGGRLVKLHLRKRMLEQETSGCFVSAGGDASVQDADGQRDILAEEEEATMRGLVVIDPGCSTPLASPGSAPSLSRMELGHLYKVGACTKIVRDVYRLSFITGYAN